MLIGDNSNYYYLLRPGHFKRSKEAHIQHITNIATKMYKNGSKAIRKNIRNLFLKLDAEFAKGTQAATRQINLEFNTLLKNHSILENQDSDHSRFLIEKKKLQQDTIRNFEVIRADWKMVMKFDVVETEAEVKVEMPFPSLEDL